MSEHLLENARRAHQAGNLAEAARLYGEILRSQPKHFEALAQLGAIQLENRRYHEAQHLFAEAAKIDGRSPELFFHRGRALANLARHEEALASFAHALALKPNHIEARNDRGATLLALNRWGEALSSFDKVLERQPDVALAHNNRAAALLGLGRYQDALAAAERALALDPNRADAWYNRGAAEAGLQRYESAIADFTRALSLNRDYPEGLQYRGVALAFLKRYDEALADVDGALRLRPNSVDLLLNRGNILSEVRRDDDALSCYFKVVALQPNHADAHCNCADIFMRLGRHERALADYERALVIHPAHRAALDGRGSALMALKRYEEAAAAFERLLALDPDYPYARGMMIQAKQNCCDWRNHDADLAALTRALRAGKRAATSFLLAVSNSAADLQLCARTIVKDKFPAAAEPMWRGERHRHERIKIAYLSGDLHLHPVAVLSAGLFEHHDRTRFETIALSHGPDDGSAMRVRLSQGFERFIDVKAKNDRDIASLVRQLEIDIAVDLTGLTTRWRPAILALRPAPIQVNFLGFAGTMGADYVDYIVADHTVIPDDQRQFYDEKIAYLPGSYMPHDSKRRIAARTPSRAEAGLPERGFVFSSFNNSYKFAPQMFGVWMRLLQGLEGSVLWLPKASETAMGNLKREAEARGVAPERLVFAPLLAAAEDHLARIRLADLFLDTLPCNAHTTASDALFAGVPLLTCTGNSFASRVAASLLEAAGVPETIVDSLAAYEALGLKLAREPALLAGIRDRLARHHESAVLFDTARFTRQLEAAYIAMWQRAQAGLPPADFTVQ